jgi:hypothetical protein
MENTPSPNRPFVSARLGVISSAAWKNHDDQGNARGISVRLTKRYFDQKAAVWVNSRIYLGPQEIGAALAVLSSIQSQLLSMEMQDTEERRGHEANDNC